jgi:hypothetical protein
MQYLMMISGSKLAAYSVTKSDLGKSQSDGIQEFMEAELPSGKKKEAVLFTKFLLEAGERYDRYTEKRSEWRDYSRRRRNAERIAQLVDGLISSLGNLDVMSRDDLRRRFDPKELEALIGSLSFLRTEICDLAGGIQTDGRPRDLAEERWIVDVADVFENAFNRDAAVWGSGTGSATRRGRFYSLLELSRPKSFARHGKLSLRQIERVLKRRKKNQIRATFI